MEKVEISEELRVSLADFTKKQWSVRLSEPRRLTHLFAVKSDRPQAESSNRIFQFRVE